MIRLVKTEWFQMIADPELTAPVKPAGLINSEYPYFMEEKAFRRLEHKVASYHPQMGMECCDFLFAPTFMVSDRFQSLFQTMAPQMEFRNVTLLPDIDGSGAKPIHYWVPFLPADDAGKRVRCQQGRDKVAWLFSLEAIESILRRAPLGIRFVQVEDDRK